MKKTVTLSFDLMENMVAAKNARETNDEDRKRILRVLRKAVQGELTQRQMECVKLCYGENVSQKEAAVRLGLKPATVSRHLKKARARIRRVMSYYL